MQRMIARIDEMRIEIVFNGQIASPTGIKYDYILIIQGFLADIVISKKLTYMLEIL